MSKKRIAVISFLSLSLVLTLCFIWGNSLLNINKSSSVSSGLYLKLAPVFNAIFGEGVITHAIFRKLAHFSEFFILAVEIFLLLISLKRQPLETLVFTLLFGLFSAVLDEILQVFSGRGSSLVDVFIDFSGVVSACLIVFGLFKILSKKIKKPLD